MPPKRKNLAVTKAQVDAILRDIKPRTSGADLEKQNREDAAYRKRSMSVYKKSKKRTAASKKRTTDALYGITTGPDGKKVYAKRGPNTTEATDKYLAQRDRAKGDQLAQGGGKQKEKEKSLFNKTVDFLMRGTHASAGAFREGFDPKTPEFYEFGEAVKGFKRGISGKGKDTFKDVLADHGHTGKGMGTLGFALDIAADPTTYLGVGLIGKAGAKGSKAIAESLENTAKVTDEVVKATPSYSKKAVQESLYADRIPVRELKHRHKKNLSEQARALADDVKRQQKAAGTYRKRQAGIYETGRHGKRILDSAKRTYLDLKGVEPGAAKVVESTVLKELRDHPGLHQSLMSVRQNNLMPKGHHASNSRTPGRNQLKLNQRTFGTAAGISKLFSDTKRLDRVRASYASSGKTLSEEQLIQHVATHEIGHAASNLLTAEQRTEIGQMIIDAAKKANMPTAKWLEKNVSIKSVKDQPNLQSAMQETLAEIWAMARLNPSKAGPEVKAIYKKMSDLVSKPGGDFTRTKMLNAITEDTVAGAREIAEQSAKAEYQALLRANKVAPDSVRGKKIIAEVTAKYMKDLPDVGKVTAEMTETMLRNMSPAVKKQLALRVGGARVAIPGVAPAFGSAAKAANSVTAVQKSVEGFNKLFRANAYIPESLRHLRAKEHSIGANFVREYGREINSVWSKVPSTMRKEIAKAYGRGNTQGLGVVPGGRSARDNGPVDDVMQYLDNELNDLNTHVRNIGLSADEINSQLGKEFRLRETKGATQHTLKARTHSGKHVEIADVRHDDVMGYAAFDKDGNWLDVPSDAIQAFSRTSAQFSQNFFLESIKRGMAQGDIKDPGLALYTYAIAVNQAIAKRNLWKTIGETHGVKVNSNVGKELQNQGWRTPTIRDDAAVHGLDDVVFEPEVADAISRMAEVFGSSRSTGEFIRIYDRSLMAVKAVLTKYNPAFHPRTFMGEIILGYMGGMKPRTMPQMYEKAVEVLRGRNEEFLGGGLEGSRKYTGASRANVQTANVLRLERDQPIAGTSKIILRKQFGNRVEGLSADRLWHAYMNSGLKSGFASTDMVRGVEPGVGGRVLQQIGDSSQRATEAIEDTGRLAHFLDAIKYSKASNLDDALEEAAEIVRKAHLDYNEVTNFEKSFMARIIPFYKWLRLSTPLMAEILLTQPGKALAIPKAMDYASRAAGYDPENSSTLPGGPDAAVPDYLIDAGAVPVGRLGMGSSQWLSPTSLFPLASSAQLVGEATGDDREGIGGKLAGASGALVGVTNPLLASWFELGLDAQDKGAAPSRDYLKYAAGQTPQTNFARKMVVNEDAGEVSRLELLLKFLANPGLQSNTTRTIESAALRQQQEAYRQRTEALRPIKEKRKKEEAR